MTGEMATAADMLSLSGDLTFAHINQVCLYFFNEIKSSDESKLHVNLEKVSRIDSAGLALMIEAMKIAKKKGMQLIYTNMSDVHRKLVAFYALDEVLGFKPVL